MQDYIKLSRSILDWEWYTDINTKVLFIHMLLKANWKDGKFQGNEVKRGSFVSSIESLSTETSLTIREIRTAISHLKSTGEVTSSSTNKYTVFTVVNYDSFQSNDKQTDNQATIKRQANDKLTTTIEEKKESKKGKKKEENNIYVQQFEEVWSFYPRKQGKDKAFDYFVRDVKAGADFEEIKQGVMNYKFYCEQKQTEQQFIRMASTFFNQKSWQDDWTVIIDKPKSREEKTKEALRNFLAGEEEVNGLYD